MSSQNEVDRRNTSTDGTRSPGAAAALEGSPGDRLPAGAADARWETFDLLRGVAALCVFFFHYKGFVPAAPPSSAWLRALEWSGTSLGSVGTNLLLLISGLFVAKSVASPRFRYPTFLARRLIRIYPPYVLVVCGTVVFALVFPRLAKTGLDYSGWRTIWEQMLLWPGLSPNRPVLTVAWTLSWIMAAYVVLPLPLAAFRKLVAAPDGRSLLLTGAAVAVATLGHTSGAFSPRLSYILGGCAVFETITVMRERQGSRPKLRLVGLAALVFLALRFSVESLDFWNVLGVWRPWFRTLCGLAGIGLLSVGAFLVQSRYALPYDRFPLAWVRRLGHMGYSFYMLHGPVAKVVALMTFPAIAASDPARCWMLLPVALAAATGATAVMYVAVETPLQRLGARLK